jgi:hypothetical protein
MTNALTKSLLEQQVKPVHMVPCTVTTVTPMTVTLLGEPNIAGIKIPGATYSTGAAIALLTSPGKPLIIPIG